MQFRRGKVGKMDRHCQGGPLFHQQEQQLLEKIQEDVALTASAPWHASFQPPDTPQEPMEFLSRSWSISAKELSKALAPLSNFNAGGDSLANSGSAGSTRAASPATASSNSPASNQLPRTAPFKLPSDATAKLVMERILTPSDSHQATSRKSANFSPPPLTLRDSGAFSTTSIGSSHEFDEYTSWCMRQFASNQDLMKGNSAPNLGDHKNSNSARTNVRGRTVGRWLKDIKEKKKEDNRVHNAQVHAAVSVAGVAAAVAAVATSTATMSGNTENSLSKMNMAVASAAALVAAQCVEAAESMGADREQISCMINSAVNVKKPGDVMTLTAGAATALRGAATLKARAQKEPWNHASVIPYDKGCNSVRGLSEVTVEDSDSEMCSLDFLARGGELFKRTRKGLIRLKHVSVYINKSGQVVVKLKSRIAGALSKKKTSVVHDICKDTVHLPGRDSFERGKRHYFSLKTDHGLIEFDCKSEKEEHVWIEGIRQLLTVAHTQRKYETRVTI